MNGHFNMNHYDKVLYFFIRSSSDSTVYKIKVDSITKTTVIARENNSLSRIWERTVLRKQLLFFEGNIGKNVFLGALKLNLGSKHDFLCRVLTSWIIRLLSTSQGIFSKSNFCIENQTSSRKTVHSQHWRTHSCFGGNSNDQIIKKDRTINCNFSKTCDLTYRCLRKRR